MPTRTNTRAHTHTPRPLVRACSIQALMSAPNPDDPLDENIAKHWKSNEQEAMETARLWTRSYASA